MNQCGITGRWDFFSFKMALENFQPICHMADKAKQIVIQLNCEMRMHKLSIVKL